MATKKSVETGTRIVLCADARSFAWYMSDLEHGVPGALSRPCTVALREPVADEEHPWRVAADFDGVDLPEPDERLGVTVRVVPGKIEEAAVLLAPTGRRKKPTEVPVLTVTKHPRAAEAAPLLRVKEPPGAECLLLLGKDAAAEVIEAVHDREGGNVARCVDPVGTSQQAWLLDVGVPPWFVVERLRREGAALVLKQATKRRILVEWGLSHPFEAALAGSEPQEGFLVVRRRVGDAAGSSGFVFATVSVVESTPMEPLDLTDGGWAEEPETQGRSSETPSGIMGRIDVDMIFRRRQEPASPEAWLLPAEQIGRLERLLAIVPEDDLSYLSVADVVSDGVRWLVVREGAGARRGTRIIPSDPVETYALAVGTRGTFVPIWASLRPDLPPSAYARILGLDPSEAAFLVPRNDGALSVIRLSDTSFVPASEIVDFTLREPPRRWTDVDARDPWAVRWCNACRIMLADDQVVGGKCVRCGADVSSRLDVDRESPPREPEGPPRPEEEEEEEQEQEDVDESTPPPPERRPSSSSRIRRVGEAAEHVTEHVAALRSRLTRAFESGAQTTVSPEALDAIFASLPAGVRAAVEAAASELAGVEAPPARRRRRTT